MLNPQAVFRVIPFKCRVLCVVICTFFLTQIGAIDHAAVVAVSFLNSPWDPMSLACFPSEF